MANPTTNYGFVLPTSADLVTDLPADFDVALQGVDTRLKALNPSTTLGDTDYASATANTNTRLAIGSTGQVLTVAGGVPTWATPASGGGMTSLASGSLALSTTGVSITGITADYIHLQLIISNYTFGSDDYLAYRFNSDTGSNYSNAIQDFNGSGTSDDYNLGNETRAYSNGNFPADATGSGYVAKLDIFNYASATANKQFGITTTDLSADGTLRIGRQNVGRYRSNTAVSSIQVITFGGASFAGGSYVLYGVK
jgi:hypothetical protein